MCRVSAAESLMRGRTRAHKIVKIDDYQKIDFEVDGAVARLKNGFRHHFFKFAQNSAKTSCGPLISLKK